MPPPLLDPSIFAFLEARVEEETQVRDRLGQVVQRLERAVAAAQGLLSRVHSTPRARCAWSPPDYFFYLIFFVSCFWRASSPVVSLPDLFSLALAAGDKSRAADAAARARADPELVAGVEAAVRDEVAVVRELDEVASQHPFYKSVLPLLLPPFSPSPSLCPLFLDLVLCPQTRAPRGPRLVR